MKLVKFKTNIAINILVILISLNSQAAPDCATATELVGKNWDIVTKIFDLCQNPNSDKTKVRNLAERTFTNLSKASVNCINQCSNYADNLKFCKESYDQIPDTKNQALEICN